ncbi:MAG: outer membrane beta-barrel protein [Flavisolibacter sp.]
MKMRFFCFVASAFLMSAAAHAQSSARIQGGINLANVTVTDNGRVDDANMLTSFQVGIVGDVHLASILYFQPGVLYTGKGSKVQKGTQGNNGYFKQTFNPRYLEIPANFLVKLPIGKDSRFFAGAGPYLGIGVGGKNKTEGQTLLGVQYSSDNNIKFSNDDPTTLNEEEGAGFGIVRRFDYGLNGTVGLEGKSLVLGVNYGLGLAKLQSGSNNSQDNNNKNRVLSMTLGFKF